MRYLTSDELIKINETLAARAGKESSIMSAKALTEAIERPQLKAGDYEPFPGIWDKAAVIMDTIVKNKPFATANALTGFFAAVMMLRLNGYILRSDPKDSDQIISISLLQVTMPQIVDWLKHKSVLAEDTESGNE